MCKCVSNFVSHACIFFVGNVATPAAFRNHCNAQSSQLKAARAGTLSSGDPRGGARKRTLPCMSPSERRGRHNSKERERRKKIRLCCDELNMIVPFCSSDTDKATTLQWTTAFLRYINKMYGDTFNEASLCRTLINVKHFGCITLQLNYLRLETWGWKIRA
uniref:BHLH domain-containing protein n=1 Tax=Stegastes partitus TaxID=144197 RepID=A0A3B5A6A2_9TELE